MKRLVAIFLVIVTVFLLAGCSSSDTPREIKEAVINEDGVLVITYTDGTQNKLGTVVGKDGEKGEKGKNGSDGANGAWNGKKVLFIGDSLTDRRVFPETVKNILGIESYYHCKAGATLSTMVDGDKGINGNYNSQTDADGVLRPLTPEEVADMDLIVFYGGYNNRSMTLTQIDAAMQHAIDRIYANLKKANNMTCRLLIVTVDCAGKYPWYDADAYDVTATSSSGNTTLETIAQTQKKVAERNSIACCDLFYTSGINEKTWNYFSQESNPENSKYSPYKLDANGNATSTAKIRYVTGEYYYQKRDGKVVYEQYTGRAPYPYIGDQLHKSAAGYQRIGEVIAGSIIATYGN